MTPFEIVTAILNLLALILIPIIAVIIGQHLQNVSAKRKDKMDVFKTMMMNRIGWSVEGTRAMNIIDIVFRMITMFDRLGVNIIMLFVSRTQMIYS